MPTNAHNWSLDHSYTSLPPAFYTEVRPTPVAAPQLLLFNWSLAESLGLKYSKEDEKELAALLSGNKLPEGARPIAQAYAGHQFGHFTMLGDGRAILLGEQIAPDGSRSDIQLKGPGPTPYSRRGDGRATLSAMLREYLMSEAMHGLGIPTTRSLAVVVTGQPVYRERTQAGAVLTRVAASHLRVGTFEYARQFRGKEELETLARYAIERHYPELLASAQPYTDFLQHLMLRQTDLILHWLRVGFIHGVMNTDNMSIAGETIDYGPCAFMNAYNPDTVFSSIDTNARYAFSNQPSIAHWNLAVFASTLLPLIHPEETQAVSMVKEILNSFPEIYRDRWAKMMGAKIGLENPGSEDLLLIQELLQWMERRNADYTNTFLTLGDAVQQDPLYLDPAFQAWRQKWVSRVSALPGGIDAALTRMSSHNPCYIPRNHLVETALEAAAFRGDMKPFMDLLEVLQKPYIRQEAKDLYQQLPPESDEGYKTFCGT